MNSTGRNRSLGLTTISSERSSTSGIRNRCSSFTKASDQTGGTQISSAESKTALSCRTHWGCLSEELGSRMCSLSVTVYDSCIVSGHSMHKFNFIFCIDPFSVPSPTGTKRWDALLTAEWPRIRYAETSAIEVGGSVF